jgi:hypothetical protein
MRDVATQHFLMVFTDFFEDFCLTKMAQTAKITA